MGKIANESLKLSLEAFFEQNEDKINKTYELEKNINFLNQQIAAKLVEINNMRLSASDAEKVGRMFKTLSDIERIGDHAENIAEYALLVKDRGLKFSDVATEELKRLGNLTTDQAFRTLNAYEQEDSSELKQIKLYEKEIDQLSVDFVENHIQRLKESSCDPKSGVIFTDMIIDLERTADHAKNIASSILTSKK